MKTFIEQFIDDLVGTTYRLEDYAPENISDYLEVLTARGYLAVFHRQDHPCWIKVKEVPHDFDFLAEKESYIEHPSEDFIDIVGKELVGTVFDPRDFLPADISLFASVLANDGYLKAIGDGRWIKVEELPEDYDYASACEQYLEQLEKRTREMRTGN